MKVTEQSKTQTPFYIFIGLMFILVISIFIYHTLNKEFNPEKDVCTNWYCNYNDISKFNSEKLCHNVFSGTELTNQKCTQWRPKNVCDTEPNNEACVCDEITTDNYKLIVTCKDIIFENKIVTSAHCEIGRNPIEKGWTQLETISYLLTICTSAHLRGTE